MPARLEGDASQRQNAVLRGRKAVLTYENGFSTPMEGDTIRVAGITREKKVHAAFTRTRHINQPFDGEIRNGNCEEGCSREEGGSKEGGTGKEGRRSCKEGRGE